MCSGCGPTSSRSWTVSAGRSLHTPYVQTIGDNDTIDDLLSEAIESSGCAPRFLITDHGCQFRTRHRRALATRKIVHARSPVGTWQFNLKIDRFFRSLKFSAAGNTAPPKHLVHSGTPRRLPRAAQCPSATRGDRAAHSERGRAVYECSRTDRDSAERRR